MSISGAVVFLQQYVYIVYRRGAARHIGARKLPGEEIASQQLADVMRALIYPAIW